MAVSNLKTVKSVNFRQPFWHAMEGILSTRTLLQLVSFLASTVAATGVYGATQDWAQRWPAQELYEPDCRPLWIPNKYGPFDYRTTSPDGRELVEGAHFSLEYQAYLKGQNKSSRKGNELPPAAGMNYTLWAFPNHPQALAAMEDLAFRRKTDNLPDSLRVHCLFQRAVRFTPDDALVRALYGYYYARRGKIPEAKVQLEKAESLDEESMSLYIYLAFAYFEIKEFDKSLAAAKKAYQRGYTLPGLRNRLERAGKWQD